MWYSEKKLKRLFRSSSSQTITTPSKQHFPEDLTSVNIEKLEKIEVPGFLAAAKVVFREDDKFHTNGLLKYTVFTYKERWNLTQSGVQQVFENGLNVPILFGRIHLFVENFLNGLTLQNFEYSPLTVALDLVSAMFRISEETGDGEIILFPSDNVDLFNQFVDAYNLEMWPNGKEKKTEISLFHVGQYASPHTGQELPKVLPASIIEQTQSGVSSIIDFMKKPKDHKPQIYSREGIGIFFESKFELGKEEFHNILKLFPIVWEKEVTNDFRIYTGYKMDFSRDIFPKVNENYKKILKKWYFANIKDDALQQLQTNSEINMNIVIDICLSNQSTFNIKLNGAIS